MKHLSAATLMTVLALGACSPLPPEALVKNRGDFWQRADVTSALYTRGPQAQQQLSQDIARCVIDIRKLEELAPIRERIPADNRGGVPPDPRTPEGRLAQWDTPERRGDLYYEHIDYHDFETCMQSKGWERVGLLPPDVAAEARDNYIRTVTRDAPRPVEPQPRTSPRSEPADLNLND